MTVELKDIKVDLTDRDGTEIMHFYRTSVDGTSFVSLHPSGTYKNYVIPLHELAELLVLLSPDFALDDMGL